MAFIEQATDPPEPHQVGHELQSLFDVFRQRPFQRHAQVVQFMV